MTKRLLIAPALFAVCVLFYWKLALTGEYTWFDHPDMCFLEIPRLQMIAREVHAGRFPLWDPNFWLGQPLLGHIQPGPVFPLNIVLYLLPLQDGYLDLHWLNWYFVVARFFALAGAYALCRDLGRSRAASLLGAAIFAFAGFVGAAGWIDVANGALWTPLICLFFLRAARGLRPYANAAFSGLFLGLAWLSGHHEIPTLVSCALAAAWLWAWFRRGRACVAPAALTFVIALLVGAVQIWPAVEFALLSRRWVGLPEPSAWNDPIPYHVTAHYSLPSMQLFAAVVYEPVLHADSTLFLGVVAFALAIYAAATRWRVPPVRWMSILALVAMVYALGALTPLHGLLQSFVPLLNKTRVPVRALHLFGFPVAVLAAYGADVLSRGRERVWRRRLTIALAALAGVVFCALLFRAAVTHHRVVAVLVAASAALLIRLRPRRLTAALLLLAIAEIYPVSSRIVKSRFDPAANQHVNRLKENLDIAEYLKKQGEAVRIETNEEQYPVNFGDWHGVATVGGFAAGATSNVIALERHIPPVQRMLGVSHYVAREPKNPAQQDMFAGASGLKVFRNPDPLPRAWSVHRVEAVKDRRAVNDRLRDPVFDPTQVAFVTGSPPALESCEAGEVRLAAYAPNRVRIHSRLNCRGLVILSDTFYPGWHAGVDGKEAAVLEVNGALRGVVVESGEHEIELRYRPLSVFGGAALTLAGLLATAALAVAGRGRRTRGSRDPGALRFDIHGV